MTEVIMLASNLLRVSVVLIIVGMCMGIGMAMAQDFRLAPAHAHLNLIGFVALFLAGLYYHTVPQAAAGALAKWHAWIAVIGAVVFPIGISAVLLGGLRYEVLAIIGSLIVLTGMLLFAVIVFRNGAPQRA
jgi:cbb3-type cytochrome oxidase subunit 1